jgi:multidrug resistance efflux pump
MQSLRIVLSILLITVSLWALFLPPVFPSSAHAVVNAKTYQVNATSAGVVRDMYVAERQSISAGERAVEIEQDQDLIMDEITALSSDIKQTEEEFGAVVSALDDQGVLNTALRKQELAQVDVEIKLAEQRLADAQSMATQAADTERQHASLLESNVITLSEFQASRNAHMDARSSVNEMQAALARAQAKRAQIQAQNSAAASSQPGSKMLDPMQQSLTLRKSVLQAELNAAQRKLVQLQEVLASGARQTQSAPIDGLVWRLNVIPGQPVARNAPLLSVAHPGSVFVEAYLARHFLDAVAVGDHAVIYLNNSRKLYDGTVKSIMALEDGGGSGEDSAIASVAPGSYSIKLTIAVNDGDILVNDIGRLGKVIVTSSEPSIAEKIMVALSIALRTNA